MKEKILIVDDIAINRVMLTQILDDEYELLEAADGKSALSIIESKKEELGLVLLDLLMPGMSGYEVLKIMQKNKWMDKLPVLIITGDDNPDTEKKCFEYGISDFIRKPFDSVLVKKRVGNIVNLFHYQRELEKKVHKQTETLRKQYKLLQIQADKLNRRNEGLVEILGTVVEYRNMESGEHINRVKGFTEILAYQLMEDYPVYGLTKEKIKMIVTASALHDIGKIAIPDSILLKPGRLTPSEFEYMKSHTIRGGEFLQNIKGIWDAEIQNLAYEICRHHHERYDGKGYPDGLVGDDIPIAAQIVSIADVYDALVSERVYKSAYSKEEAFHMIIKGECGVFSPRLLECFRHVRDKFEAMRDEQENEDASCLLQTTDV